MKITKLIIGALVFTGSVMSATSSEPVEAEGSSAKTKIWSAASVVPVVAYAANVLPELGNEWELYSAGCVSAASELSSLNPSFHVDFLSNPAFMLCEYLPYLNGVSSQLHVGIKFVGTCRDFGGIECYNYLCNLEPSSFPIFSMIAAGSVTGFCLYKAYKSWMSTPNEQ